MCYVRLASLLFWFSYYYFVTSCLFVRFGWFRVCFVGLGLLLVFLFVVTELFLVLFVRMFPWCGLVVGYCVLFGFCS